MKVKLFEMLKADHKEVSDIFETLSEQEPMDRELVKEVCQKLQLHMEIEEKLFYPALLEAQDTEDMGKEAELEHGEAKKFMKALLSDKLDDTEVKVKVEMLQLAIEHHVEEEENEIFKQAQKTLDKDLLDEISTKAEALKEKKLAAATK